MKAQQAREMVVAAIDEMGKQWKSLSLEAGLVADGSYGNSLVNHMKHDLSDILAHYAGGMKFNKDSIFFLDFDTLQQVKYRTHYFRANPFFNGVFKLFSDPNPAGMLGLVDQTWVDRNRSFLRNQVGQKLNVKNQNVSKLGKEAAKKTKLASRGAVVPVASRLRNVFERDGRGQLKLLYQDELDADGEPRVLTGESQNRYDLKCARGVYRCRFQLTLNGEPVENIHTVDIRLQKNLGKNRFWRLEKTTREEIAVKDAMREQTQRSHLSNAFSKTEKQALKSRPIALEFQPKMRRDRSDHTFKKA